MEGLHAEHAKLLAMSLVSPLQQRECLGTPGSNVEKEMTPKVKMATPTDKCVEHSEKWDAQTSSQISAHPKCRAPAAERVPVSGENESYVVSWTQIAIPHTNLQRYRELSILRESDLSG